VHYAGYGGHSNEESCMRRIHVNGIVGLMAAAALAGCAGTPSKVTSLGDNTYQLSVNGTRAATQADTNFKAFLAASDYCGQLGQQALFRQSQESGEHIWSPKREDLTFVCMSANDPAYLRAGLKRDSEARVIAKE
jgi:hypothetical protein